MMAARSPEEKPRCRDVSAARSSWRLSLPSLSESYLSKACARARTHARGHRRAGTRAQTGGHGQAGGDDGAGGKGRGVKTHEELGHTVHTNVLGKTSGSEVSWHNLALLGWRQPSACSIVCIVDYSAPRTSRAPLRSAMSLVRRASMSALGRMSPHSSSAVNTLATGVSLQRERSRPWWRGGQRGGARSCTHRPRRAFEQHAYCVFLVFALVFV